jgi:hypothetical protein
MYDGVSSAIRAWVNGNTESVIDWLWEQKPNVVALFCREFVFNNPYPCKDEPDIGDMDKAEEQLNVICNRLMDRMMKERTDLTPEEKRRMGH